MENPRNPGFIATAGEALIDLIGRPDGSYEACMGGAVFNLARALASQEVHTLYLNPFSGDRFGRQLRESMQRSGVHVAQAKAVNEVTSLAVVGVGEQGQPDYAFYREKVADRAVTAQALAQACDGPYPVDMVCTGALALAPQDQGIYLPWLRAQKAAGRIVVVDANLRPSVMKDMAAYRSNVLEALQLAHLIKVSDEDLQHLALAGEGALDCAQRLLRGTQAHLMALTLGDEGACLLAQEQGQVRVWRARETQSVNVVDTVGAGDCFLAGLLAALRRNSWHQQRPLLALPADAACEVLAHAVASASLCVMQRGCVPPSWQEAADRAQRVLSQAG